MLFKRHQDVYIFFLKLRMDFSFKFEQIISNAIEVEKKIEFRFINLPVSLPNSSKISSLPFDLGIFPTNRRRFGTLIFIFRHLPGFIS